MVKSQTSEKLLASLKRHNPSKVRAYAGDDDVRDIAVPTRRRRWSQVIEAIEARAWSRVELLDKSGGVLGYVENTEPATEPEDLGPAGGGRVTEVQRLVEMFTRSQERTLQMAFAHRDAEVVNVMQAQGAVVRELVQGMHALTAMYQQQVTVAADVAANQAALAAGDGDALKQLVDAAPMILQMMPLLKGLLNGNAGKPAVSNGHSKPPA
jgi:hypothetical protein